MPAYRHQLPQLTGGVFLTDGGIETTLIYDDGFDLPDFAAFPLLDAAAGHAALQRYFDAYLDVAVRRGRHRADADVAGFARLGRPPVLHRAPSDRVNQAAVDLLVAARHRWERPTPVVISGCIVPAVTATTRAPDDGRGGPPTTPGRRRSPPPRQT